MNSKSFIYILFTAFAFGTMEVALKIAGGAFTALQLTFLRFLIGGIVLLPVAVIDLKKKEYKLTKSDILYLLLLGIVGICFSMTLFQVGVMQTNANLAAMIISINPLFTMIFAHFMVNDRFTKKKAVVLFLGIIGLVFVANPFNMAEGNSIKGILTVLVASIAFGLYSTMGKLRVGKIGGPALNSLSFLMGAAVELIIMLFLGEPVFAGIAVQNLPVVLYVGLVVTGFGYFCYLKAIEISGPSNASVAFFIKPIIALVLAAIMLSEPITWNIIVGTVLILGGSIYNLVGGKKFAENKNV